MPAKRICVEINNVIKLAFSLIKKKRKNCPQSVRPAATTSEITRAIKPHIHAYIYTVIITRAVNISP